MTTVVVGITIVNAKVGVQLEMMGVLRDVGFYILATTVIIIYGIIGRLTLVDGCILLCLYFVLVIIVVV